MKRAAALLAAALLLPALAAAQTKQHDALNAKEVDQLRMTAQEPDKRLPLFLDFARARLAAIEQLRSDPRFADGRGDRIHDMLADFGQIVDELGDNVDQYNQENMDIRKPLKQVIEGATEFQLKLRALKDSATTPLAQREASAYKFVLEDDTDSVNSLLDDSRKMLDDQEQKVKAAKEAKKRKK